MTKVHELIRNPEGKSNFAEHTEELRRRAHVAHKLLSEQDLTLE